MASSTGTDSKKGVELINPPGPSHLVRLANEGSELPVLVHADALSCSARLHRLTVPTGSKEIPTREFGNPRFQIPWRVGKGSRR